MAGTRQSEPSRESKERRTWLSRWLIALLAIAGLVAAVLHFGELERFAAMLRRAQPLWLVAAAALQAGTYVAVALGWTTVLRRAGSPQPLGRLLPVALVKLFADQAIPGAGMGGNVVLVDRLIALGVPRGAAVAALLVSLIGYYAAYASFAMVMLAVLWLHGHATPLLVGLVTTFLLVALAIPALALWLRARGSAPLPPRLEHIGVVRKLLGIMGEAPKRLVTDRPLILKVAAFNGLVFLADAATLAFCLCALGEPLRAGSSFIALMTASIVATLGPIPMGLGSFEATSTAMLGALGVPVEAAIAGTLLLRGFTLWLPLVPGMVLMRTRPRARRAAR
ncbi:flippase-like domain-containing protein [Sphingomonas cannabina]|uniref:lysylphosphatidylglycerol synthase transmembrane domain-containing protein n=1 Tax=Sphingomonas cannabina TaxID=2899123 RepID=UPI001F23925E|nr:lysylphosphatidylglycerol synthase transmembrane domain-containing protein [Sphingomonas cannabina]UIJ46327.1 flippase-like domain-containing protein [Sphingomonas cannabina]